VTVGGRFSLLMALVVLVAPLGDRAVAVAGESAASPTTAGGAAADSGSTTGPAVVLDKTSAEPDEYVVLTITGFISDRVLIEFCGNEARRGSADCNLAKGEGLRLDRGANGATIHKVPVSEPPADCPCIVRLTSRDTGELAVAPIEIVGHPIGDVVDPPVVGPLVTATVSAKESPDGTMSFVRGALGGPARYEVTVTVTNTSTFTLKSARASTTFRRGPDDSWRSVEIDGPGIVIPGQTWSQSAYVIVPAPSFGEIEWQVVVNGAGPNVTAASTTSHRPFLLIVMVLLLVLMIGMLLIRILMRRHQAKNDEEAEEPVEEQPLVGASH
jgi:hypothetical protein